MSGRSEVDALLYGYSWLLSGDRKVTYSLASAEGDWSGYAIDSEPYVGFSEFPEISRMALQTVLEKWQYIANIDFTRHDESEGGAGLVRIGFTTYRMAADILGFTYAPSEKPSGGDIWLNSSLQDGVLDAFPVGPFFEFALIHEVGHALGLKHPHGASPYNLTKLDPAIDSLFESAMSYFAWPDVPLTINSIDRLPVSPMTLDIDALQYLYGTNLTSRSEDDVYSFSSDGRYLETIFDTGGTDTFQVTGSNSSKIDLRPDNWSQVGAPVEIDGGRVRSDSTIRIYRETLIEHAVCGEGDDHVFGNTLDNHLKGGGGADWIDGGEGQDTIEGGAGFDTLTGGGGSDLFVVDANMHDWDLILDFSENDLVAFDAMKISVPAEITVANFSIHKARDSDDYLIYKPIKKKLYLDLDGSGQEHTPVKLVAFKGADARDLDFTNLSFL
jgi:serralysin